jgi:glycerophosphoryl diester phosphodiesterase
VRILGPVLALLVVLTGTAVLAAPANGVPASRCRVAAHRGDHSGDATENGMWAMRRAAALGAEVLEGDVRATSDDGLVMMHDRSVRRTTTGRGFVDRLTFRRVRAIRLLDGTPVPALWQVLRLARTTHREALVELKRMGTWRSYRRLATLVERFGVGHVVVQSRVPARLDRIRRLVPRIRTALVTRRPLPAEQVAAAGGVVVEQHAVTDAWLDTVAGELVFVWTVDDAVGWERFGPRATVVTDDPRGFIAARPSFCH